MKTIAVTNRKGGVGKSTTALNLAAGLTQRGYKTLVIDTDPQGNLTDTMRADNEPLGTFDLLKGTEPSKAIKTTPQGDLTASTDNLALAGVTFTETGKEYKLAEALEPLQGQYDYCIIDTPPALDVLTLQALTAADYVIIPTQPDIYGIKGIRKLEQTIETIRKYCNPKLTIAGVLVTRYRASTVKNETIEYLATVAKEQLHSRLFETYIRECNALFEAQVLKTDIYTHAPKSNATADYRAFTDELLQAIQ